MVFKATNRETGETVAIKCVKNSKPKRYRRRENKFLKKLHHPNCIEIRDEYYEKTSNNSSCLVNIVMDYFQHTLYSVMKR